MEGNPGHPGGETPSLEERLERGDLVHFPICPFPLPDESQRTFLFEQTLASSVHKNISYDPAAGRAGGFALRSREQTERLKEVFADFSNRVTTWLSQTLPGYAQGWRLDRVGFRPEEEATRRLRHTARNDLLHIDAFPSRPTQGYRILRLYVNVNPTEPRIWTTSDRFAQLLERFGAQVGLPSARGVGWARRVSEGLLGLFTPTRRHRTVYDTFMLDFHDYLKANEAFQEHAAKRFWIFGPGSAWLLFSDGLSHADLRGRFALDHSYFVAPRTLLMPEQSPAVLLEKACGASVLIRAA